MLEHFKLDPAYAVSQPHIALQAMLLYNNTEVELLTDSGMFRMVVEAIRGGIACINKRLATANHEGLGAAHPVDPMRAFKRIFYIDCNNLYGAAMSAPHAVGDFRWEKPAEMMAFDWLSHDSTAERGYFLEVDLEYPDEIHNRHNQYPFCPQRISITKAQLSEQQVELRRHYNMPHSDVYSKLICNLYQKDHYVIHSRMLALVLKHGLVLKRVHRAFSFK